jgi:hypothetical protein
MPDRMPDHPDYKQKMDRLGSIFFPFPYIIIFLFISIFRPSPLDHSPHFADIFANFGFSIFDVSRCFVFLLMISLVILWSHFGRSEVDWIKEWLHPQRFDFKGECAFVAHFILIFVILGITIVSVYDLHQFAFWYALYRLLDWGSWIWRRAYIGVLLSDTRNRINNFAHDHNLASIGSLYLAICDALEVYYFAKRHYLRIWIDGGTAALVSLITVPSIQIQIGNLVQELPISAVLPSQENLLTGGYLLLMIVIISCEYTVGRWRSEVRSKLEGLRQQLSPWTADQIGAAQG